MSVLQFAVYEPQGGELIEVGTLATNLPARGVVKFCPGTLDRFKSGVKKAIAMLIEDGTGKSVTVPLSRIVSRAVANALEAGTDKVDVIAAIANLPMFELSDGAGFVIGRKGTPGGDEVGVTVASIKTNKVLSYEELVAF